AAGAAEDHPAAVHRGDGRAGHRDRHALSGDSYSDGLSQARVPGGTVPQRGAHRARDGDPAAVSCDGAVGCRPGRRGDQRDSRRTSPVSASVSIVIPVYNEEGGLGELFARLYPALDQLQRPYELLFVDDGSHDRSVAILREQFEKRPDVTRVV